MASQQPLRRLLGVDENLVSKLASEGLHTVGDIFSKTELQLVQSLDIDRSKVIKVLDYVASRIVPELKTAASLLRERREAGASFFVSTGLPAIDNALQVVQSTGSKTCCSAFRTLWESEKELNGHVLSKDSLLDLCN